MTSPTFDSCSVLICVYHGDKPQYLSECLESILSQSVPSNDIVIVIDGPISDELKKVLEAYASKNSHIRLLHLKNNLGVGAASNRGIKLCKNELIAKMDADDISVKNRFEMQLKAFNKNPELAVIGGQLAEFTNDNPKNIVSYRKVPTSLQEIKQFARRRSPFNNQTVMYRKSIVEAAGAYPQLNRAEDYYLFSKIIAMGYPVANLKQTLALFRLDQAALQRRKTWRHTKENISARRQIYKLGLMRPSDLILTSIAQLGVFILPTFLVRNVYKLLRHR